MVQLLDKIDRQLEILGGLFFFSMVTMIVMIKPSIFTNKFDKYNPRDLRRESFETIYFKTRASASPRQIL